jgi:manganese oxidase
MASRGLHAVLGSLSGLRPDHALRLLALLALVAAPALAQPSTPYSGVTRVYYIAAVEQQWEYAPAGRDLMMGHDFTAAESTWVGRGPHRIGSRYLKARYVAYTDSTFATPATIAPEWEHLGILGPVIRAEVGDSINVVFRNMASRPYTVHAHGVFYDKGSEGAMTLDGTTPREMLDDHVRSGTTFTYHWFVPERAGPGPADPTSVAWLYHSHIDPTEDTNAGLVGAIIVTQAGRARDDGSPDDVDREFVTLYTVFDENVSPYLDENLRRFADDPAGTDVEDAGFVESNLMHTINGYVFGSLPLMTMSRGERVRWYVVAVGTEVDLHTPHWHGNVVVHDGHRVDVVPLLPAEMKVADMVADSPGIWMFHCHVNDHADAGMTGRYQVR